MQNIIKSRFFLFFSLVFLILIFRLPFLPGNIDFNNDAPTYSRNIEKDFFSNTYDVHMPGYVSYIYLGRGINFFVNNPVVSQHIINIILIILITILFYKLLSLFGLNRFELFLYSLFFSFNNILMLGSVTGGNRLFLTLCSIILMYFAIEILIHEKLELILFFALFFAFFIGFRQDISFYFLPLYIFLLVKVKDAKLILLSILLFGVVCISWFVPLLLEYGGIVEYILRFKSQKAVYNTSIIFSGITLSPILNMLRIFIYILNSFLFIFPFFIYSIIKKQFRFSKNEFFILGLAFLPAFIFQMLVHNGNFVHLASFMTPLFLFLIANFRIDTFKKRLVCLLLPFVLLFQFYGIRMLKEDNIYKKAANVLWFQYSYDGVKMGETLRLKMLQDDLDNNNTTH